MTRRQTAAFITICLIWGSTWAAIRIAVTQVAPLRVAALRFIAAGLLMLPFAFWRKMVFPRGRALKATIILGTVMIGAQYALVFTAAHYISSGLTAILYASSPLVVGFVSPRILGRPVPRAVLTAMLVGLGGMMLLLRSIAVASASQVVPALVMLFCMLISSIGSVFASRELQQVSTFAASAIQFLIGGAVLMFLSLGLEHQPAGAWTWSAFAALLFLIIFGSMIAFSLYFWLLQNVEPYRVITVQFIIPIIAVIEGTLLLHETIPLAELCGGVVVLLAGFFGCYVCQPTRMVTSTYSQVTGMTPLRNQREFKNENNGDLCFICTSIASANRGCYALRALGLMGASLYIVIEGDDPGFDIFVNGHALARNEDSLEQLAEQLQVAHLLDFFSADAISMSLLEEEGYKLPTKAENLPPTQWFSAEDGLITVTALHDYMEANPECLGDDTAPAIKELEEYMTVLEKAASHNLRWHLAVSWR